MQNHRRLAARLAGVLGLGSITHAMGACGGKVIFDGGGGSDVGGSTATGLAVDASSSTGGACTVPVPSGDTKEHVCVVGLKKPCPPITDPTLKDIIATQLNGGTVGCTQKAVDKVACGPTFAGATCCYDVFTTPLGCAGRPFIVLGVTRTAEVAVRADWPSATEVSTDAVSSGAIANLDPTTRQSLAEAWSRDALFEHASIASFARFALELLEVGAPSALVRDAQRAMGDEIRHTELSFALASAYAGAPRGPSRLSTEGMIPSRTLAEVAGSTAREGCVNETIAALLALDARDAATDPGARAALAEIATDEATHGELAWRTVAWALSIGGADVRESVTRAFAEAQIEVPSVEPLGAKALLRAHGQLSCDERRASIARALDEVVGPTARALLARQWPAEAAGLGASGALGAGAPPDGAFGAPPSTAGLGAAGVEVA